MQISQLDSIIKLDGWEPKPGERLQAPPGFSFHHLQTLQIISIIYLKVGIMADMTMSLIKPQPDLQSVRDWADEKLKEEGIFMVDWYQYMKLRESLDDILTSKTHMAKYQLECHLQLVDSN
ncbi:MAG: hypothetical protein GY941_03915 [Planctomycetes bacterium]|nr:hypothetical protein [Planctomycetota bacterium]